MSAEPNHLLDLLLCLGRVIEGPPSKQRETPEPEQESRKSGVDSHVPTLAERPIARRDGTTRDVIGPCHLSHAGFAE